MSNLICAVRDMTVQKLVPDLIRIPSIHFSKISERPFGRFGPS